MAEGKFVAYYRVSTDKQGKSGLGLEAQQAAVRSYLNGGDWSVVAEFVEVETGTRKGNARPELAKALAACKSHRATLVIAKLDRLARNVHFVSGLKESGVHFVCVDMPDANRLTINVLAAVAEHEAEMTSQRTKEALAAAKVRGVVLGKPENFSDAGRERGQRAQRDRATAAYAGLSRLVVNLRSDGQSYRAIAEHLNGLGFTTAINKTPFNAMTVKRIHDRATSPAHAAL